MASVKDVKNAFVEDDAVIVPAPASGMGPSPRNDRRRTGTALTRKGKGRNGGRWTTKRSTCLCVNGGTRP